MLVATRQSRLVDSIKGSVFRAPNERIVMWNLTSKNLSDLHPVAINITCPKEVRYIAHNARRDRETNGLIAVVYRDHDKEIVEDFTNG